MKVLTNFQSLLHGMYTATVLDTRETEEKRGTQNIRKDMRLPLALRK